MAAYITWKNYYSVNDLSLDAEHKQVIDYINELYVAMNSPTDSAAKKHVLEQLIRYTHTHFDHEEKVMQAAGYPDAAAHKTLHDEMRKRSVALRTHLSAVTARDVLVFLKDWWLDHIQGEDKKYSVFVEPVTAR